MEDEKALEKGGILKAIMAISQQMGPIEKGGTNTDDGYSYIKSNDLNRIVGKLFKEHNVFVTKEILDLRSEVRGSSVWRIITIKYYFWHVDGSFISTESVGEGCDHTDKASNMAMVSAYKYALLNLFTISVSDNDDSEGPKEKEKKKTYSDWKDPLASGDSSPERKHIVERGVAIMMNASDAEKAAYKKKVNETLDLLELEDYVSMIERNHGVKS